MLQKVGKLMFCQLGGGDNQSHCHYMIIMYALMAFIVTLLVTTITTLYGLTIYLK